MTTEEGAGMPPELRARLSEQITRHYLAYAGPTGTWAQRWLPWVCQHTHIRCTHGDEIIHRHWRRRICLVCGRALRGPIPFLCWFTGKPHYTSTLEAPR